MRTPALNRLHMFDVAARRLNFRAAGEELNVSQGAVAQQVRRLEDELNVKLFVREARGLRLTRVGAAYHDSIRRGLSIIDRATENLVPDSSKVKISVTPTVASRWLLPKLGEFSQEHPQITLEIDSSVTLANFTTDGVDLAIRQGPAPTNPALHARLMRPVAVIAMCSPQYAAKHEPAKCLEDFSKHDLIQDIHRVWDRLFEDADLVPPTQIFNFNLTDLALRAAEDGHGVALVPTLIGDLDLNSGRLVELWRPEKDWGTGFYLVGLKSENQREAVQIFADWCLNQVREQE